VKEAMGNVLTNATAGPGDQDPFRRHFNPPR
jgi:hypothetical protein